MRRHLRVHRMGRPVKKNRYDGEVEGVKMLNHHLFLQQPHPHSYHQQQQHLQPHHHHHHHLYNVHPNVAVNSMLRGY